MTIASKRSASLLGAAATLIFSTTSSANLNTQFSQCANTALESQSASARKISVELPSNQAKAMDHAQSSEFREFKMELVNSKSGQKLGVVSCRVNKEGQIESVQYLTKA